METPEQRANRIFAEDEEKRMEERMEGQRDMLLRNQLKRQETVEQYRAFIEDSVQGKQKGIRYRKWLRGYLYHGATTLFASEDAEYGYINKFGRGPWDGNDIRKSFNAKEQAIIVEIARKYGAFDY
jgi:hypothetical protein